MDNDAFGLLSTAPNLQPFFEALDLAESDADIERFMEYWAVLFTDLSRFSAEPVLVRSLQRVRQMERALQSILTLPTAQLLKSQGDSHLLLFKTVPLALEAVKKLKQALPGNQFCVGISYGPIIVLPHNHGRVDAVGKPVNEASKLGEDTAKEDECLLTPFAHLQLNMTHRQRCKPRTYNGLMCYEWRDV